MTTNNLALYKLLVKFGASEEDAANAVAAENSTLVTRADLRAEMAELKASLVMWMIGVMLAMTGVFLAIVRAVVR